MRAREGKAHHPPQNICERENSTNTIKSHDHYVMQQVAISSLIFDFPRVYKNFFLHEKGEREEKILVCMYA